MSKERLLFPRSEKEIKQEAVLRQEALKKELPLLHKHVYGNKHILDSVSTPLLPFTNFNNENPERTPAMYLSGLFIYTDSNIYQFVHTIQNSSDLSRTLLFKNPGYDETRIIYADEVVMISSKPTYGGDTVLHPDYVEYYRGNPLESDPSDFIDIADLTIGFISRFKSETITGATLSLPGHSEGFIKE